MKSIFYLLGIVIAVAAAVFSYLTGQKHLELTKKTYKTRVINDKLEDDKKFLSGRKLKIEEHRDKGDKTEEVAVAIELRKSRAITGQQDFLNLAPKQDRSAYVIGDVSFMPYNKGLENDETSEAVKFVQKPAEDTETAKAMTNASSKIKSVLSSYINNTLADQIRRTQVEVDDEESTKKGLEGQIAKYEAAETKISKMFTAEGITTLEGGKKKLAQLQRTQKSRVNEEDNLNAEQEEFKENLTKNKTKIASQMKYFEDRKISLRTNEKTFKVNNVDFDWGFVVIKGDGEAKFFVNQELIVLRGNKFIGSVVVSTVEPGRILANIDYKSLKPGMKIRRGDRAIVAEPVDK